MAPRQRRYDFENPTPGEWIVSCGAIYAEGNRGCLLLADRENPRTLPTERDANIRLAANAVNFLRNLERTFGPLIDSNEDYPGTDAVDDVIKLVQDARKVLCVDAI